MFRSAFDNIIVDMLRPLADVGVSPHVFSNLLLEIKTKMYYKKYISYLEEVAFKKRHQITSLVTEDIPLFSSFADPVGYDGRVPGSQLLTDLLLSHHEKLRPYFDLEMKKRGGEEYHVDVSYKV